MNRQDIKILQSLRGYPSLTITLPTHRTSPDNRQDPIRVRNLVAQATERLLSEFSRREIAPLLQRLDELAGQLDYRNMLDGLALYVSKEYGQIFFLPFTLPERVVVDESFLTRDLVYALHRTPRYWVLALSEQPTRLFEGTRDTLVEITAGAFPMTHEGPGGAAPLPGGFGVRKSAYRDEQHRQFFRKVDDELGKVLADDPLPLAVVGVDRHLSFFNELTAHQSAIKTTLTGSHDKTSAHELAKLVWPLVQANMEGRIRLSLDDLGAAIKGQRYASGIGEAWRLAHEGRGRTLLVEEDYHYPATVDATNLRLIPAEDATAPGVMDDAVDELIELVMSQGGEAVFVHNGDLEQHQRIALILRY